MLGTPQVPKSVDRPTSRLSKRMTWKPLSASARTKASGQIVSCAPRPMINSSAGSALAPRVSYSISMPFALTRVTLPPRVRRSVSPALPRPPIGERAKPQPRAAERESGQQDGQRSQIDLTAQRARLREQRIALGPLAHQRSGGDRMRGAACRFIVDAQHGKLEV